MSNKYLEKIANWEPIEPGLSYHLPTRVFAITGKKTQEINDHLDKKTIRNTTLGLGSGLALAGVAGIMENSIRHPGSMGKALRGSAVAALGLGALGAAGGYGLGRLKNNKIHKSPNALNYRLANEVHHRAATHYNKLLNPGNK
jgi:hypothetical protein